MHVQVVLYITLFSVTPGNEAIVQPALMTNNCMHGGLEVDEILHPK